MKNKRKKLIANHPCTFVLLTFILLFAILLIFTPKNEYSENEKRVLAKFPEFSFSSLTDGSYTKGVEEYVSDHFPLRDIFIGINSYSDHLSGRGNKDVYVLSDGSLVAAPGNFDDERCKRNIAIIDSFSSKTEIESYVMAVPSPGYVKNDMLPVYHKEYHDEEIFSLLENNLKNSNLIDLRASFDSQNDIYYNTDHHVTGKGSYIMYLEYCKAIGITPSSSFDNIEKIDGFYGTNYSKSGLWLTKPDTLEIRRSSNNSQFTVTIDDISSKSTHNSLYFYSHAKNMDKYPVFLDGNHPITTIQNHSNTNGKKLLIVKDSYAHCFSSFICEEFETVIMVDLRYYKGSVSSLMEENEITHLLYLYGAENLASMSDLAFLR